MANSDFLDNSSGQSRAANSPKMEGKLRVLDLFSGLGGWSQAFRDRGHEVITVDQEKRFRPTIVSDVRDLDLKLLDFFEPHLILASPPCQKFSVFTLKTNWHRHVQKPKTQAAVEAIELVLKTREIISILNPPYFIIENPVGKLRKLPILKDLTNHTITYCQYGEKRMKPTDLWGGFPPSLKLKPRCAPGASCHVRWYENQATQGDLIRKRPELVAKIPYQLSLAVCLAVEHDIATFYK